MKCAYCNRPNSLVAYANGDCLIYFCDQLCLGVFENETARMATKEQQKVPYFREPRGSLGETVELHDLQQAGTQGSLWPLDD